MTDRDEVEFYHFEKIHLGQRVFVKEIKDQMRMPGKFVTKFILKNDSFRGFDKSHLVEVKVEKELERKPFEYHKEDIDAMKQPGLMQSVMDPT